MQSLYELTGDILDILYQLDGDEVPDNLADQLTALEQDRTMKVQNIVKWLRSREAREVGIQAEVDRLTAARDAERRKVAWAKTYLKDSMEAIGEDRIETELFTVSLVKNPPKCVIAEDVKVEALPEAFVTKIPASLEPNKKAILEAAKAKKELPDGVSVVQERRLSIR